MKILMISYYEDFARYFEYIANCINDLEECEVINLCYYPSALNYFNSKRIKARFIPKELSNVKVEYGNDKEYKGIYLDEVIRFNKKSHEINNRDSHIKLIYRAKQYIDYFEGLFKKEEFDIFISPGDTRLGTEIAIKIAKKYNVKIYYFEQGPFNTTMIDENGVNNNISYEYKKNDITEEQINNLDEYLNTKRGLKYFNSKGYKKQIKNRLDILYMYPPKLLRGIFPIDIQLGESLEKIMYNKLVNLYRKKRIVNSNIEKKYILFILQVPVDAQFILNSSNYDCFYKMLIDIHKIIPKGYNLIVREHPNYIGMYDKRIYKYIENNKEIQLINGNNLYELIDGSELVVLNNSTVGIETLSRYKKVLTLGEAYYNRSNITFNYNSKTNLNKLINSSLNKIIDTEEINKFLYDFIFNYLYLGHFQDLNLQSGEIIAKKILNNNMKSRK